MVKKAIRGFIENIAKYLNKYLNTRIIFVIDMVVSLAATITSMLIVNVFSSVDIFSPQVSALWLGSSLIVSYLLILALKSYRIIIRHSSMRDLGKFAYISLLKAFALFAILVIALGEEKLGLAILACEFFITFSMFLFVRIAMFIVYDFVKIRVHDKKKSENILIYGRTDKSAAILTRLENSPHYNIVGFICYCQRGPRQTIGEVPVFTFESNEELERVLQDSSADAVLFAREDEAREEQDRLISYVNGKDIKILFAPAIDEVKDGNLNSLRQIRNIRIEDLLMRQEIQISMDKIVDNFQGKVVMVTGAAGSIGSELCRQLASFGVKELVLFDNSETPMHYLRLELEEKYPDLTFTPIIGDVRIKARLDYAFRKWKPQVVFHAAAYKHVPLMEENPCEAVLVNVAGSRNVADKCLEYDVEKMVMISTDKAVNPTNIMGCTKRLAEIYVQSLGLAMEQGKIKGKTKFVTTRFGNVLGSNGSVIPRFREQIENGGPVTVTHPDINRFFMTIPEACRLVMEAATMSTGNQIFVFDMGESVKIDTLARRMIMLAGFVPDKDIKIKYTGLRPGEKLYEEVLSNKENTLPTNHSRIRIAQVREYDYNDAAAAADKLEEYSRAVIIPEMVQLMKEVVPEFISKNSRFEIYDKK
jgi:FlaA1/EpsC-like NDP-sugar epimerase